MATREELESKNKDELVELARERDLEGRSGMNKEELVNALADDSSSNSETSEGSEERLETVEEEAGQEHADLAAHELDEHGPLHTQAPSEREMTGAVSQEQAEEQREALANRPDDYVGPVSEAGFDEDGNPVTDSVTLSDDSDPELQEKKAEGTVKQQDVIDFGGSFQEQEAQRRGIDVDEVDIEPKQSEATDGPFSTTITIGGRRNFGQKAVFYTDGISGLADSNLERAYDVPEALQSNDPQVRAAGDESESQAAEEAKPEEEKREAEEVKGGSREE